MLLANARSLEYKIDSVFHKIDAYKLSVVFISETWLKKRNSFVSVIILRYIRIFRKITRAASNSSRFQMCTHFPPKKKNYTTINLTDDVTCRRTTEIGLLLLLLSFSL